MSTVTVHCVNGHADRLRLATKAQEAKLSAHVPWDHNPHAFTVSHQDSNAVSAFLRQLSKDPNYALIDSTTSAGKYRAHLRRHDAKAKAEAPADESKAKTKATPATTYGRTAAYMAKYYNFPMPSFTKQRVCLAVISLGGGYQQSDLDTYFQTVLGYPKDQCPTVITVAIDGAKPKYTGSDVDVENALDLQILGGICPNSIILFISAPNTDQGFYDAFNTAVAGATVNGVQYKPSVVSCSWGAPESTFGSSVLRAYDQCFQLGNAAGVTFTAAAGDSGSSDGDGATIPRCDFPASSPNVTACGGTSLTGAIEVAWSWSKYYGWGTGGGISAMFKAPTYQQSVITYPTNTQPSLTSLKGNRGVPDISLNADPISGWTIQFDGSPLVNEIGGTSCVAPAVAGLLGLMNLRYPTSFNASLYAVYGSANRITCFRDITSGTNDDLRHSVGVYSCGKGYDFVTGLGAVNGFNLYAQLQTTLTKVNGSGKGIRRGGMHPIMRLMVLRARRQRKA